MAKSHHARKAVAPPLWERLVSRRARLIAFLALFALVALTGGASRGDVSSLVVLRPMAVLFGAYALLAMPKGQLGDFRWLVVLIVAAMALVGAHLIPLPPSLWRGLPYRETIADLDRLLGLGEVWRPLALSPAGAWNAFFALFVPLAGLLSYAALDPRDRPYLLPAIGAFALVSAVVGLLQLTDPNGPLYFYTITNEGLPVGFFSNRNHHAVMLALAMPALALWAVNMTSRPTWVMPTCVAAEVMLLLVILLTGSRAGLVCGAIGAAATVLVLAGRPRTARVMKPGEAPRLSRHRLVMLGALVAFAAVVALLMFFDRDLALDRVLATDPETEIRVQAFPLVFDMLRENWALGVGAGSFAAAFEIIEPVTMLGPNYLNHAHSDWLELPVEYGVPGVLLLAGFLLLLATYSLRLWTGLVRLSWSSRLAILAPPAILAAASIGDYPLRSPSLAMLAVLWLAAMADAPARILASTKRRKA